MSDEPQLSEAMEADLAALMRGEAPPERVWYLRPWKVGEPAWCRFVGRAGDVHIYPVRITVYDATVMDRYPGSARTPLIIWELDPMNGEMMTGLADEAHYQIRDLIPRIVEGETW